MKTNVYNQTGETVNTVELASQIFDRAKVSPEVVHLVAVAALANARQPIAATKTRGMVRGGGKKPWKQKGTGRARVGSIRSPLWRGGGIIFGPTPARNFSKKVNRKTKRLGMFSLLTDRAREERILVLDNLELAAGKTRELNEKLKSLGKLLKGRNILLIVPTKQEKLARASRNLPNVKLSLANNLNVIDLLWAETIIILQNALPVLEQTYLKTAAK